jgi:hypothetical protein
MGRGEPAALVKRLNTRKSRLIIFEKQLSTSLIGGVTQFQRTPLNVVRVSINEPLSLVKYIDQ